MLIDIIDKLLLFLFLLSSLNVIRNSFFLIKNIVDKERFMLNKSSLIVLGMSIAYILLVLIDGIKI